MASSEERAKTTPGPNQFESRQTIIETLKDADLPAMTAGDIAKASGLARKTVYNHAPSIVETDGRINKGKIGGNTAYWYEEPKTGGGINISMLRAHYRENIAHGIAKEAQKKFGWWALLWSLTTIAMYLHPAVPWFLTTLGFGMSVFTLLVFLSATGVNWYYGDIEVRP